MKTYTKYMVVLLFFGLIIGQANAQTVPVERMEYVWKNMKDMVVKSAKLMPEENYNFSATDSVRNFSDQLRHIATGVRFFPAYLAGKLDEAKVANQNTLSAVKGKDAIVTDLEQAFDFVIENLKNIENFDEIITPYGNTVSKYELLMQAEHHLHREHGKIIVMMRMNNIAPARSSSWFK